MPIFRSSALLYDRMYSMICFIEFSSPSRGPVSSPISELSAPQRLKRCNTSLSLLHISLKGAV